MGYSKPIWIDVEACIYQSSKSFGAKDTSKQTIYVGSSAKNSHEFAEIIVTRRIDDEGNVVFKLSVDGKILKEAKFENNKGRAGNLIGRIKSKLNRIKSL